MHNLSGSIVTLDWPHFLENCGNNATVAKQFLAEFAKELPSQLAEIETAYNQQDFANLKFKIHRLHGSASYCAANDLKNLTAELEVILSSQTKPELINKEVIGERLNLVKNSITALIQWIKNHNEQP